MCLFSIQMIRNQREITNHNHPPNHFLLFLIFVTVIVLTVSDEMDPISTAVLAHQLEGQTPTLLSHGERDKINNKNETLQ